jgi:hypothetical protein
MGKIPILGTVSRAYGFLLGEIGTIVRLTWAPLLLGAGLSYLYGGEALDAAIAAGNDPSRALAQAPAQVVIGTVAFVTGVIATVALLRVTIFGDRKPGLFVYLWLGAAELRLLVVTILLVVAFIAAGIGVGLVFALLAALTAAMPVFSVVLMLGLGALIVAAIWVPIRLSLIAPVVVAENSLGVERSWELTKGNALRMLAVLLLTFVPYVIVSLLAFTAILGGDFPAFPALPDFAGAEPAKSEAAMKAAAEAFQKVLDQWQTDVAKAMRAHWPEVSVLTFVGNLVSTALWAGATGSAYTAVAGERRG